MNINTLNRILVFIPLAIAILIEVKTFKIWEQIQFLWDKGASPIHQLFILSPHSFRYFLMYPVVSIPENLGFDKSFFFSLIALLLGFLTAGLIINSVKLINREQRRLNTASLFISCFIVFLLFFMNGRGVFALFGFALLVNNITKLIIGISPNIWMFANIFLALLFCSVSSGTLAVSFLTFTIYLFSQLQQNPSSVLHLRSSKAHFLLFLVGLLFCVIFSSMIVVGLIKNLDFYGSGYEGFVKMFGHGLGVFFIPLLNAISLPILVTVSILVAVIFNIVAKTFRHPFIVRILFICVACGLFGYTTLSMAIVPLLIMLSSLLPDFKLFKGRSSV